MNFSTTNPSPIRRWLDAFVAMPDRIRLPLAIVLALLVHGLAMVAVWLWPLVAGLLQKILPESMTTALVAPPPPPQANKKLEVILMTPAPPPAEEKKELTVQEQNLIEEKFRQLPEEVQQEYVDVEGLAKKKNLSKRALLESWQDSVAGTKKPGKGDGALPAQDGRADLPFTNFKNQRATAGDAKISAENEVASRPRPMPTARPPGAEPPPIYKPRPISKADLAAAQQSPDKIPKTADPAPAEQPTPTPTPRPAQMQITKADPPSALKKVIEADENQIALYLRQPEQPAIPVEQPAPEPPQKATPTPTPPPALKPTPQPTPEPKKPAEPKPTPPISIIVAQKVPQQPPRPQPVQNPGYIQHMEQRKIEGGNAPVGESGVDAVATVRGRYVKGVNQAIGSRWTHYVHDPKHGSLIATGSVTLRITLNGKGKVLKVQLLDNTSNAAHAALCERSFYDAQGDIEPPPSELLKNGLFEDTFTFTLY